MSKVTKWYGITYPAVLANALAYNVWRNVLCRYGWHLFDEVVSCADATRHYLVCDAGCGLTIFLFDSEVGDHTWVASVQTERSEP